MFVRRRSGQPDDASLERIAEQLRIDDPTDPPYKAGRFAQWASSGLMPEGTAAERPLAGSPVRGPLLGGLGVGTIALALILVVGFLAARSNQSTQTGTSPSPSSGDLLAQVRAAGVLRMAIRPDFPQATTDKLAGFDVDVATALAARLDVRLEIVIVEAAEMASPGGGTADWDLGMPSSSLLSAAGSLSQSDVYYAFPAFLVVPDASTAQTPTDLAGGRVCVVAGSAGEAWIAGRVEGATVAQPAGITAGRIEPDDQACLDAMGAGEVDASVTSTLTAADIAVRPSVRILGQPVLLDRRSIVARVVRPDAAALMQSVDAALRDMRADGTLVDLSRSRFGGQDLTGP